MRVFRDLSTFNKFVLDNDCFVFFAFIVSSLLFFSLTFQSCTKRFTISSKVFTRSSHLLISCFCRCKRVCRFLFFVIKFDNLSLNSIASSMNNCDWEIYSWLDLCICLCDSYICLILNSHVDLSYIWFAKLFSCHCCIEFARLFSCHCDIKFVDVINNCEDECNCLDCEVSVFVSSVFKMIVNVLLTEVRMFDFVINLRVDLRVAMIDWVSDVAMSSSVIFIDSSASLLAFLFEISLLIWNSSFEFINLFALFFFRICFIFTNSRLFISHQLRLRSISTQ